MKHMLAAYVGLLTCILLLSRGHVSAELQDLPDAQFKEVPGDVIWLDVDLFFGASYDAVVAMLRGSGFRLATKAELQAALTGESTVPGVLAGKTGGFAIPTTCCRTVQGWYDDSASGTDPMRGGLGGAFEQRLPAGSQFNFFDDAQDNTWFSPGSGAWIRQIEPTGPELRTPAGSDIDNDGIDEKIVWRGSFGLWFVRLSKTNEVLVQQWGLPGDTPLLGDFDGDLVPDFAVWRPTTGVWYIKRSSRGYSVLGSIQQQFGLPGDHALRVDYDGDGRLDLAVWRPSEGNFYYRNSGNQATTVVQWGLPGDIPLVSGRVLP